MKSNETAAFIVDQLKEEISKEAIVAALLDEYDFDGIENPGYIVSQDVEKILSKLREIGAIED